MKELGALPGVRATRTTIVLETTKESFELPILPKPSKSPRKKEQP
jgi:hypothetical protein